MKTNDLKNKEPAVKYGQLITQERNGRTHLSRIRLYDDHNYNWHQTLISVYVNSENKLWCCTDQVYDLEATSDYERSLKRFSKVWFNGVLIYKCPWWRFW